MSNYSYQRAQGQSEIGRQETLGEKRKIKMLGDKAELYLQKFYFGKFEKVNFSIFLNRSKQHFLNETK